MDNKLDEVIEDSDYSDYAVKFNKLLLEASKMILRLEDTTLTSVFVGELMELQHIESKDERMDWLEDIYQDLSDNPDEQSETAKLRSTSDSDKQRLKELLHYFDVELDLPKLAVSA